MDKKLILNRIKTEKNFKTDAELAAFLGISRSVLSNWYKRNSIDWDLVLSKCEQMDYSYLITGVKVEINPVDNEWILRRFEEIVSEKTLLQKKIEELELSRGTPPDTPNYDMPEKKLGSFLAAEPVSSKHTR